LLDLRPYRHDCGITEQTHDDSALLAGLLYGEQCLSGNPSVGHRLVVGLALTLSDDDIESIVAEIHALTRPLHAVAYHGYRFVLEYLAGLFKRIFLAGDDRFLYATEI
jgi:hypothetical protein